MPLEQTSIPHVIQPVEWPPAGLAWRLVRVMGRVQHRHRALIDWDRNLPRARGREHLPERVWQGRAALLSPRANGILR